ncbi:hypothetical protein BH10BAC2_BH10BAC2_48640 [soil metagenome]
MTEMQKFVYDEVMAELKEMKDLFFLGKKNWSHLLIGKLFDMTASGIVGATLSNEIIASFNKDFPHLIK